MFGILRTLNACGVVLGGKTDKNAHPHMDFDNRIALVHNGTINNATDLRRELQAKGIFFRSETDSEVGPIEFHTRANLGTCSWRRFFLAVVFWTSPWIPTMLLVVLYRLRVHFVPLFS